MAAIVALGLSRSQLALAGGLTALAAGLGALVVAEWSAAAPPAIEASAPAAGASRPAEPAPVFALPPLTSFAAVTDRPLFSPDRRPKPQAETLGSWSALSLAGIIVTPEAREVLIAHDKPPQLVHLQEGQSVDGWVVRKIEPDRVVVANGGEQHELGFRDKHEDERAAVGNPRRARPAVRD